MCVCQKLRPQLPTLSKLRNARLLILTTAVLSYLEKVDQQIRKALIEYAHTLELQINHVGMVRFR
jgi:hypothetical protein